MGYETKNDGVSMRRDSDTSATTAGANADADAAAAAACNTPQPSSKAASSSQQRAGLLLSMDDFNGFRQIGKGKDSAVYAAYCPKLGGRGVCLKVYDKGRVSAVKARAVRREARVMRFLTEARCVL
jgi:hypothetical protein